MESYIRLRDLLSGLDPTQFKAHCAVWNGEEHPLDVYARSPDEWVAWNTWRSTKHEFNRPYIFSLMQVYAERDRWLFGGAFRVLAHRNEPNSFAYDIELCEDILPGCIGRLKVKFQHRGRTIRLRFESVIDRMEVAEILPTPYHGEPFPGHDSINHSLSQLEAIYAQQRPDWRLALENMKGVYVIHDRDTGMPYVGSARGDTGIWQRWGQYVDTAHGGNAALRALVKRKGVAYARENLMFALLEFWAMRTSDDFVLAREEYWKRVLLSKRSGLNL
jgi:hypothetical protein